MIISQWKKLTHQGVERFTDNEEIKNYKIVNSSILVLIILNIINFLGIMLISIVDESFRTKENFPILFKYLMVSLASGVILISLLKLSINTGRTLLIQFLQLVIAYAIVCSLSFMLGPRVGMQYYLILFIFFPIFYYGLSVIFKISISLIIFSLTVFIFYLLYQIKPFYPFPLYIEKVLFICIISFLGILFSLLMMYLAWQFSIGSKIKTTWNFITDLGVDKFTDEEDIKSHIILNSGIIIIQSLNIFMTIAILLIPILDSSYRYGELIKLVFIYLSIPIGFTLIYTVLYFLNCKTGKTLLFGVILHLIVITQIVIYSFMLGHNTGIQYFLLPTVLVPLFYAKIKTITKLIISLPNIVFIGIAMFIQYKTSALFPVSSYIEVIGFKIIIFFLSGTFSIMGIYLWWQFNVTKKVVNLWRWISELGLKDEMPFREKKERKTLNRLASFVLVAGILSLLISIIVYIIIIRINFNYYLHHFIVVIPPFATTIAAFLPLYFNKKDHTTIIRIAILSIAIFIVSINSFCILWGEKGSVHNLFYLFYMFVLGVKKDYRKLIIIAIILISINFIAINISYHYFNPLFEYLPNEEWIISIVNIISIYLPIIGLPYLIFMFWSDSNYLEDNLEAEQEKSENLILNILPFQVAKELKEKGVSEPVRYELVSVLFTDFVGFTQIAEKLESKELLGELDKCFSYFDSITKRYNLEKIKTIGDSYMLAGGLPEENYTHAFDCCLAALEIQAFMNQMKEIKDGQGLPYWELRLGINTGSVVAGVIGEMKFAYDIFGDSVNTASRMESSGTPGKINISLETYNIVKFLFNCEHRGKVAAKRKGDIDMFYVNGIKPRYSVNGEGRVPNDRFQEIYEKLAGGAKLVAKSSA